MGERKRERKRVSIWFWLWICNWGDCDGDGDVLPKMASRRQAKETSLAGKEKGNKDDLGVEEWDKDKLLDTLYWIKQVVGIVCGVVFGLIPVTGLLGAAFFAATTLLITYWFYHSHLQLDEDDYGGHNALLGEGFMPGFFLFQLFWILTYSLLHH